MNDFNNFDAQQFAALMAAGERGRLTLVGAHLTGDTSGRIFAVLGIVQNLGKAEDGKDNVAVLPLGVLYREGDTPDLTPPDNLSKTKNVTFVSRDEFTRNEKTVPTVRDTIDGRNKPVQQMTALVAELVETMAQFTDNPSHELADKLKDIRRRGVAIGAITQEMCDEFNKDTDEVLDKLSHMKQVPIKVDRSDEGLGIKDAVMAIDLDAHDCANCESTGTCPTALQQAVALLRQTGELSDTDRATLNRLLSEVMSRPVAVMRKQ